MVARSCLVPGRFYFTWADVLIIALVSFAGHFIVTRIGYRLGVRDVKS